MNTNKKLTKQEAQAAERIGRRLAESCSLFDMTEGDILDVVDVASDAIGLPDGKFHSFNLKIYKTILEKKPDYAQRLVAEFRREIAASED